MSRKVMSRTSVSRPAATGASNSAAPAPVRTRAALKPSSSPNGPPPSQQSAATMSALSPIASGQILHRDWIRHVDSSGVGLDPGGAGAAVAAVPQQRQLPLLDAERGQQLG